MPAALSIRERQQTVAMREEGQRCTAIAAQLNRDYETVRGKRAHEVWAVDAKEQVELADGRFVSWLTVTDEGRGAILGAFLCPHQALGANRSVAGESSTARVDDVLGLSRKDPYGCVRQYLSGFSLQRKVEKNGRIPLFANPYFVSKQSARRYVEVHFDAVTDDWIICDEYSENCDDIPPKS